MLKINNNLIQKSLKTLGLMALALTIALPSTAGATLPFYYHDGGNYSYNNQPVYNNTPSYYGPSTYTNNNYNYNNNNNYNNYGTPVIYSITPNQASIGNGSTVVQISGANFTPGSVARWNSSSRTTTFLSSSRLNMTLYPSDFAGNGNFLITVYDSFNGDVSNAVVFTVTNTVGTVAGASVATPTTYYNNVSPASPSAAIKKATTTKATETKKPEVKVEEKKDDGSVLGASAVSSGSSFLPSGIVQWILLMILILLAVILWRKLYVSEEERSVPLKHA